MTKTCCGCRREDGSKKDGAKCLASPYRPIRTRAQYDAAVRRLATTISYMDRHGLLPKGGVSGKTAPFADFVTAR